MRYKTVAALSGLLLFVSGLALGQQTRISALRKYSVPAQATVLDWMLLEAEMNELRGRAAYGGWRIESVLERSGSCAYDEYNIRAIAIVDRRFGCPTLGFWFSNGAGFDFSSSSFFAVARHLAHGGYLHAQPFAALSRARRSALPHFQLLPSFAALEDSAGAKHLRAGTW